MKNQKTLKSPLGKRKHIDFVLSIDLEGENGYNKTVSHTPRNDELGWVGNPTMRILGVKMKANETVKKILQQILSAEIDLSEQELKQIENLQNKCKNLYISQDYYANELKQLQKFYKKLREWDKKNDFSEEKPLHGKHL